MHFRATTVLLLAAAALAAACKDETPIPHTPTSIVIVSGSNQTANVSSPLDSTLVVQVFDAAHRPVSGVALAWAVTGGGSVQSPTTTSGDDGKSTNKWTLAATPGTQAVTVTSPQMTGAAVSFLATNGATITGTVTSSGVSPFSATNSRTSRRSPSFNAVAANRGTRRPSSNRILVGFKEGALHVAAAASGAYRSISVARNTMTAMRQRASSLIAAHPAMTKPELSPAILTARFHVTDTTQIDAIIASLKSDPNVAWAEREQVLTIRDGAPRPMAATFVPAVDQTVPSAAAAATKLPNDRSYFEQTWTANMLDLPKAWNVTTGSNAVMVAVVDMGVRFDHPEVASAYTTDGYDFVSSDTVFGADQPLCDGNGNLESTFVTTNGDGDGPDTDPTDPDDIEFDPNFGCWFHNTLGDHGLWTSGIIGAPGNDNNGIAGVSWAVKIRPVRVLGIDGSGFFFDIAQGVLYAAGLPATGANGALVQATSRAPIINMSLGGTADVTVMRQAVAAAVNAGSLLIASAGNDELEIATYPAAYPGVMGVSGVGMDGQLAGYSNAGTFVSVAAPGGEFRLDLNGGGGVLGPGWDFENDRATDLFGYGTSAAAPFVSGIAALLLAHDPSLTAAQIRSRIETYATRPTGVSRTDRTGWGIVNAYNALTQTNGAARAGTVRLVNAVTGIVNQSTRVDENGHFVFTEVSNGTYYVQAGEDEGGDGVIGVAGRRFAVAGGVGSPTVVNVNNNSSTVALVLGTPTEVEPNDDVAHANVLTVGSWVAGSVTPPDVQDVYSVQIPAAGTYTFETSGLVGSCGFGYELDTQLSLSTAGGTSVATSNDFGLATSPFCARITTTLQPGIYYVTVTGSSLRGLADHGRYRLEVRSGS